MNMLKNEELGLLNYFFTNSNKILTLRSGVMLAKKHAEKDHS